MSREELPETPGAWRGRVWSLSWPVVLSNATVPLAGAVDTAVMGQSPDPAYIGAVAFGALIFNFFAWIFGFLRMGTTGFAAQAWGAGDLDEVSATACRASLLALLIAIAVWMLQTPIRHVAFWCLGGSPEVEALASAYYHVRVWGLPSAMLNHVALGLLFGLQRMRLALALQLALNGVNIGLDMLFAQGFGWGVPGVALATVIAETSAATLGLALVWRSLRRLGCRWPHRNLLDRRRLKALFEVNANLTIRTLCVQMTSFYMTAASVRLPALAHRGALGGGVGLFARWHLSRRDAYGRDAQRHALGLVRVFHLRLGDATAPAQSWPMALLRSVPFGSFPSSRLVVSPH